MSDVLPGLLIFSKKKPWLMFEDVRQGRNRRRRGRLLPWYALTETNTKVTRSHRSMETYRC